MTPVNEKEVWAEKINQMDVGDRVLGGDDGPINQPIKNLTNRTAYLRALIAKVISEAGILNNNQDTGLLAQAIKELMLNCKVLNAVQADCADEAVKLKEPCKIDDVYFDGSQDIRIVPAGAISYFAMPNPPTGWLVADGSPVPRDQYKDLFAVIGTFYGAGDGKTTFNIPDLRGEFIRSWDAGRGVDKNRMFGSWQTGTPISHDDEALPEWFDVVAMSYSARSFGDEWVGQLPDAYTSQPFTYKVPADRPQFFTMTRPRNVALLCCIKY